MNSSIFPSITTSSHILTSKRHYLQPPPLHLTRTTTNDNNNTPAIDGGSANALPPSDPNPVQIKFKRGARRKTRRKQDNGFDDNVMMRKEVVKKDWEAMTVTEKAVELYVGEKGLLFWINKFAYASIYIIIGAWILFRFVGPALNLYQLDAPPLSPADVLKGSPK
ncbi:hypothetical protein L1987_68483 [Smallanthus sonchifolius]|uniref:Uncharacterized protein n=1 Tax=Smallanthus sonchifolius TaxID=185202 RepID=A0ACB9B4I0_9ASTR|nr:hypothetical protein L1987_68483 [Smallanthus sonchifolius]